jgi:succinyl-diaminopimelate desuccinylase
MSRLPDPVDLTAALVRCPTVTPEEGGALVLLEQVLSEAGFACTRVDRGGVPNLFARWGPRGHPRSFGFNGHTDVVPVGDVAAWTVDPFGGEIRDGRLYGRGACDMKSGVAAFVAAAVRFVTETPPEGAVIVTVTGDEEGSSTDGTVALLDWMAEQGERMSVCIVGEPTCPEKMGDMLKIGRRGALSVWLTATGKQGHSAYPQRALNPLTALVRLCDRLAATELDAGSAHFDPSTLALTTIDVGNTATNVIPARATAALNIRFNDLHTGAGLIRWIEDQAARVTEETGVPIAVRSKISGESFLTPPGPFPDLVARAVAAETNRTPAFSTSGGTSDARFIKDHCPVVEFGLVGQTMHQVDESVEVAHIERLEAVYRRVLADWFARG